jgi:hypothetical protein
MRINSTTRYATLAAIVGALACAGNKARTDENPQPDERAAARDTTSGRDTLNGQVQNPPGYRGMERDTTVAPPTQQTPSDTFLQNQGEGTPQDTAGYSGIERDTTHAQPGRTDTTGYGRDTSAVRDTSGMSGMRDSAAVRTDTTQSNQSRQNQSGLDSTGQSRTGDTTGYSPSQQARDSTSR